MAAITALLEEIRGEQAPADRFDLRSTELPRTGDPRQPEEGLVTRVAVLGNGSWGTAFSMVLADAGADVVLWGRRAEAAEAINRAHENADYLPGIALPESISATADAAAALVQRRGGRARRAVADAARAT